MGDHRGCMYMAVFERCHGSQTHPVAHHRYTHPEDTPPEPFQPEDKTGNKETLCATALVRFVLCNSDSVLRDALILG